MKEVINVSKQFLPSVAAGFNSPKLSVNIEDGCIFLKEHQGIFDLIITDSTDPIGIAAFCSNIVLMLATVQYAMQ